MSVLESVAVSESALMLFSCAATAEGKPGHGHSESCMPGQRCCWSDLMSQQWLLRRFKLGHFDPPEANPYSQIPPSVIGHPRHLSLAVEAAAKSIVLLKNEVDKVTGRPALPLDLGSLGKVA